MNVTYVHEDIQINSEFPVTVEQKIIDMIQEKPIANQDTLTDSSYYRDYRPTKLQFDIRSEQSIQEMDITIPYNNRLTTVEAKHSVLCRYDETSQQWIALNTTLDTQEKQIQAHVSQTGTFGVFVNYYWYSTYTQEIANEYPHWTRIRKSKESNGQRFLNFFGLHLEEIEEWLNWIQEQKYIGTVDVHVLDWVYMYELIDVNQEDDLKLFDQTNNQTKSVPILETIREFFYNQQNEGGIIDYEQKRFFSKYKYEKLRGVLNRNGQIIEFETQGTPYHIWNTLDEFGLLLGVQRLYLEKNQDFKERILDVFRYPANSSDEGLTNALGRELDLVMRSITDSEGKKTPLLWKDDRKGFYLKNTSGWPIDARTLRVDGQPLKENQYSMDATCNIYIYPMNTGKSHQISFIYGIEKHELHNKQDESLYQMMYQPDGQATSRLLHWVEYINTIAPVMWDRFKWDEGFWDTIDKKLTGLGYIPNIWDSDIEIWKSYKFNPKRWESENIWQ